ncbi:MAG: HAMP domain-containing histidine kinase [Clostridia bacterium]|nr:HAMP domain-containing histidine kinase [Clostridia bacterium]
MMKKRNRFSSANDATAMIVLLFCMTIVAVGCILGITYLVEYGFYTEGDNGQTAKSVAVQIYSIDDSEMAKDYYNCIYEKSDEPLMNWYHEKFSPENSSYAFSITDVNGAVRLSSPQASGHSYETIANSSDYTGKQLFYAYNEKSEPELLVLNYAVSSGEDMIANDKYTQAFRWIDIADTLKFFVFVVLFIAVLIVIILLSLITINAGNTDEETGEIIPGAVEKVPLDVLTLCLVSLFIVAWMIIGLTSAADVEMVLNNFVVMITCVAAVFVVMTYLTSLSVRVKMGKFYKNTVIYMIYRNFKRKTPRKVRRIFYDMSAFKKLIIGIVVFFLVEAAILIGIAYHGILKPEPVSADNVLLTFITIWAITRLVIIPIFAMIAINLHYVKEEGERIAEGIMGDSSITDKLTISSIRSHGKNLDMIKKEINRAMEQELKSEKLKSELITNVSHDLKTPLTSIKNYVDLLQREDLSDEDRKNYTKTIAKHTDKLSMLLSNLLEASQISSGNIEVNLEKTSLNIMLEQSIEEFSIKFMQSDLLPRVNMPEDDIYIMGDGQWLWRIFSNLLNNACKYAAADTDVEITLENRDGKATVEIANISGTELNIEGEELFERFVRGDSSRHTEGNGLGLSIAKSLVELQGGTMNISVSGERFAVSIIFDAVK